MHYAVTAVNRYGAESTPTQQPHAATEATANPLIHNDGKRITLTDTNKKPYDGYIMVKDITGRAVAAMPCIGGKADVSGIAEGFYSIYTLNPKGTAHRMGFTEIRRKDMSHQPTQHTR